MQRAHGIMFHHFHNNRHYRGQGSIDGRTFRNILRHFEKRLLPAQTWYEKALAGTLKPDDLCITFDDALLCQYDIAMPILEEVGLTAFWFINTSVLDGVPEKLEIYRKFRHLFFDSIDDFYQHFFTVAMQSEWKDTIANGLENYSHDLFANYPFYTPNDTKFRYIRNYLLSQKAYETIMNTMIKEAGADPKNLGCDLWVREEHLLDLHRKGHIIGLHSHTHPVDIASLPEQIQRKEYETNHRRLTQLLGIPPTTVAHPADSYNETTLRILNELGIKVGFEATMHPNTDSSLTFPREDHTTVQRYIEKTISP